MFQGSLEEVKLPDVIQLMSVSAKSGCFVLTRDQAEGRIYLEEGNIVHAVCGKTQGEEAIYALAIWDKGQFRFDQDVAPPNKTVAKPNTKILMEVARKLDEWRVLSKRIPSLDLIPELDSLGHKKVSFNTQEWHVLSKINGVNSINRIAEMTHLPAMEVAKLVYGLVASGLVHLRETPKASPDANPLDNRKPKQGAARSPEEEVEWLSNKVEKIYQYSKNVLGEIAHSVIQRHCANGVKNVNQGKGISAVIEAASQIVKAAQILEGPEKSKELTAGLKRIIKEP
ncbi:MAG: DUF4388 domain-containing protein [Acidobacteriota bacterium]|nr:DUF4388 domain-containing protein [Acidobacteriota bacterium]